MKLATLKSLYIDELKDLHNAETQLTDALPEMAMAASHPELKAAFRSHLEQTFRHVDRLSTILEELEESTSGEECEAMMGLIKESKEMIEDFGDPDVRDVALIACAQRVEHYEMAAYGTVRTFAKHLGYDEHVQLLQDTLDEEGEADKTLTAIAEGSWFTSGLNAEAAHK